ncbi:TonB-linked SusC/RagA family outer membrane protein [Dyadobacter jejuensis]|uniref:TonB-linked SusC/RagA family outer membrane protein n=1 Tax=Dyadobacter jejuensis TaxID=1082580 RepID=A0A316AKW5_9BACT|nr:TonB-dependent receptor [Dyadobacter jejuensis]PWJ58018.1 TonB-linked SusC/RagA family outer membrane protein [Dyadobacter jejuensis]
MEKVFSYLKLWGKILCLPLLVALLLPSTTMAAANNHQELLNIRVSLEIRDQNVKSVLQIIEKQADVRFSYSPQIVPIKKIVSVKANNKRLGDLLDDLLLPLNVKYLVSGNQIILQKEIKPVPASQPKAGTANSASIRAVKGISGTVKDEKGEGLPGVSIVVKGTQIGTISNVDGSYKLEVPEDKHVIAFSFLGYLPLELDIRTATSFDVALEPDTQTLDDVVVIGYGTQKKSDVTGSVATVSGKDVVKTTAAGVDQALQGRVAGVTVTANSGSPGSAVTVKVRGVGTVGNSSPLYVVDGVPLSSILSLNMQDVESINILKDASASAIYGSRAANGVVLITTKQGTSGKTQISYSGSIGVQSSWKKLDVLNAQQWATLYNEASVNDGLPINPELTDPASLPSYDWTKLAYQNGVIQNHQLSVAGGSDKGKYYLSINNLKQDGIIKTTGYERLSLRSNNSYKLTDRIEVGSSLSYSHSTRTSSGGEAGIEIDNRLAYQGYVMDPVTAIYKADGSENTSPYRTNSISPLVQMNYNKTKAYENYLYANGFIKIDLAEGLFLRSNYAVTKGDNFGDNFLPAYFASGYQSRKVNTYSSNRATTTYNVWTSTLNYAKDFNSHHLDAMLGYETQATKYNFITASRNDIPTSITNPTLGSGNIGSASNGGTQSASQLISFFGRVNYSFDNRYYVTANLRRDGSSRFGPSNKWGLFPSFAAGWDITNEKFFHSNLINLLKLRGGYGEIGNQNFADYAYFQTISTGSNVTFGSPEILNPGLAPQSQGNPNLKWETAKSTNIGVDIGLFRNQLNVTADYFVKYTSDMILRLPVVDIVGLVTPPYQNAGKMKNSGVELSANYRKDFGGLKLDVGGNISFIRNKVMNLGPAGNSIQVKGLINYAPIGITQVGGSVGSFIGYRADGLLQTQAEVDASSQPTAKPGDVKYVDINKDGQIDGSDRTIIGSPLPKATYGINLGLEFKNFDLSALFQGSQGNQIYSLVDYAMDGNVTTNSTTAILNRWTGPGTSNSIPRLTRIYNGQNVMPSSRFVHDGSYLRLKNLQLGYNFKPELLQAIHIEKLRLYLGAQNLLTWTKYLGLDPEIGNDPNANSPLDLGMDRGTYPQARAFLVGLNVTF